MSTTKTVLAATAALMLMGCPELGTQERTISAELPENPTWANDIKPIMDKYCNECHSVPPQQLAPGTLRLDVCETVAGLPGAQDQAARTQLRMVDLVPTPMPPVTYAPQPTDDDKEIVRRWVDQGAPCDGDQPTNVQPGDMGPNVVTMDMGTADMPVGMDAAMDMPGMDMPGADMDAGMDADASPVPHPMWVNITNLLKNSRIAGANACSNAGCHGQMGGIGAFEVPPQATPEQLQALVENTTAQRGDMNLLITPNNILESELYLRVAEANNEGYRMPRPGNEIDTELRDALQTWIEAGAPYLQ